MGHPLRKKSWLRLCHGEKYTKTSSLRIPPTNSKAQQNYMKRMWQSQMVLKNCDGPKVPNLFFLEQFVRFSRFHIESLLSHTKLFLCSWWNLLIFLLSSLSAQYLTTNAFECMLVSLRKKELQPSIYRCHCSPDYWSRVVVERGIIMSHECNLFASISVLIVILMHTQF